MDLTPANIEAFQERFSSFLEAAPDVMELSALEKLLTERQLTPA